MTLRFAAAPVLLPALLLAALPAAAPAGVLSGFRRGVYPPQSSSSSSSCPFFPFLVLPPESARARHASTTSSRMPSVIRG